jgi:hypothetical protein
MDFIVDTLCLPIMLQTPFVTLWSTFLAAMFAAITSW